MKSFICKKTERHKSECKERVVIYIFGLCIYMHVYPIDTETKPRNVGFMQYSSEVECNEYLSDEEI